MTKFPPEYQYMLDQIASETGTPLPVVNSVCTLVWDMIREGMGNLEELNNFNIKYLGKLYTSEKFIKLVRVKLDKINETHKNKTYVHEDTRDSE